jgi:hypothetical protein
LNYFENKTFNKKDYNPGFPSTSSNYVFTRSNFGGVGALSSQIHILNVWKFGNLHPLNQTLRKPVGVRQNVNGFDEDGNPKISYTLVIDKNLKEEFERHKADVDIDLLDEAIEEIPFAEPVALAEALKIRVITKGPPVSGYVLKPLQLFLHRILRNHPTFKLIGEPVTEEVLKDKFRKVLKGGQKFISGDYKEATDGLWSAISERIAHRICDIIFAESDFEPQYAECFRELFIRLLTRHELRCDSKERFESAPQKNGQLMGSIVSFPVLCIANAVLCRMALEYHGLRRKKLRNHPLLINGDDCVFIGDIRVFEVWKVLCLYFNMKPSVGKTYFSAEFLNINSTTFLYDFNKNIRKDGMFWVESEHNFVQVPFLNFGLLKHYKRSGGPMGPQDIFSEFGSFSDTCKDLLTTTPRHCVDAAYNYYIREFGRLAKRCNIKIPWFIPRNRGGVGLLPFGRYNFSKKDERIASLMKKDGVGFRNFGKFSTWGLHRYLENNYFKDLDTEPVSAEYDEAYTYLVMFSFYSAALIGGQKTSLESPAMGYQNPLHPFSSTLLDPRFVKALNVDSKDWLTDSQKNETIKSLRHAERTWKKYLKELNRKVNVSNPWLFPEVDLPRIRFGVLD